MATTGTATNSSVTVPVSQYTSGQNLPVPLYGGSAMTVSTSYDGTKSELVVPFIAAMYADASANVGVMARQDVTVTGIDNVFDVTTTLQQAVDLLNSFTVQDVDQAGMLGLSAEVAVGFSNATFQSALAAIISDADLNDNSLDASNVHLHAYLQKETHADLLSALAHDALANMLEASDMDVNIALDASSGAANMATEFETNAHKEQYLKALFTQIPEYTIEQYLKVSDGSNNLGVEDVSGINFLPLLTGDVLTFVFDVTIGQYDSNNIPSSGANVQRVFRDASPNYPTATGNTAWNVSGDITFAADASNSYVEQAAVTPFIMPNGLTFLAPTKRRVALKVTLGTAEEASGKVFDLAGSIYGGSLAPSATNAAGEVTATA